MSDCNETIQQMKADYDSCVWTEDEDATWDTECGNKHMFFADGPFANHHKFCPYCGKRIVEDRYCDPTLADPTVEDMAEYRADRAADEQCGVGE